MKRILAHGPWLIATALGLWQLWLLRHFLVDDSFIPLRYLMFWHNGNGLVWNIGEHVEGYSSPLLIFLLMPFAGLGLGMLSIARLLGLIGLASLAALFLRHLRGAPRELRSLAIVVLLTNIPLLYWSQSGLETVTFTALVAAAVFATLAGLDGGRVRPWLLALLFALATLARPEGALFACIAFGALMVRAPGPAIRSAALYAMAIVCHVIWRHSYYGDWLPNTFYAKLGGALNRDSLVYAWYYLSPLFLRPPFLGIAGFFACCFAWHDQQRRGGTLFLLACAVAYLAYLVRIGGDWMPEHRFLTPLVPLFLMMALRGFRAHEAEFLGWKHRAWMPWMALLFCLFPWAHFREAPAPKFPLYLDTIADYMDTHWPHGSLIALNPAGAVPTHTMDMRYIDMLGINDRTIAHGPSRTPPNSFMPGHNRGDGAYVLSRQPDYVIFGDGLGNGTKPIYLSEQDLMQSPEFAEEYALRVVVLPFHAPGIHTDHLDFHYYERRK